MNLKNPTSNLIVILFTATAALALTACRPADTPAPAGDASVYRPDRKSVV